MIPKIPKEYFDPKEFITVGVIFLICSLVMYFAPESTEILRFQSKEISNGELWRIFTANFTHSNWNHFLLNMAGLLVMDYIFQPLIKQRIRAALLVFCIATNLILLHSFVFLEWYVGLSGALHGYIVGLSLLSWKNPKSCVSVVQFGPSLNLVTKFHMAIPALILLGTAIKLFVELNWDINKATAGLIGANVVEESHLCGAISGIGFLGVFALFKIKRKTGQKKALS